MANTNMAVVLFGKSQQHKLVGIAQSL